MTVEAAAALATSREVAVEVAGATAAAMEANCHQAAQVTVVASRGSPRLGTSASRRDPRALAYAHDLQLSARDCEDCGHASLAYANVANEGGGDDGDGEDDGGGEDDERELRPPLQPPLVPLVPLSSPSSPPSSPNTTAANAYGLICKMDWPEAAVGVPLHSRLPGVAQCNLRHSCR